MKKRKKPASTRKKVKGKKKVRSKKSRPAKSAGQKQEKDKVRSGKITSEDADRQLIESATRKRAEGKKLTQREQAAIRREERTRDEKMAATFYQRGIPLHELVNNTPADKKSLARWEARGLKSNREGGRKFFPVFELVGFIWQRYIKTGTQGGSPDGPDHLTKATIEGREIDTELKKFRLDRESGRVIDRSEHVEICMQMVLEVKAALFGLASSAAPLLAGKSAAQTRKILEGKFRWVCEEMARGRVPIPPGTDDAIAKAIKKRRRK